MNKEEILETIARHACEVIPDLKGRKFVPGDSLKKLVVFSTGLSSTTEYVSDRGKAMPFWNPSPAPPGAMPNLGVTPR